jgi:hypothetical protein
MLTLSGEHGIYWSPQQVKFFRRVILQENTATFARHWNREDGRELRSRTVESWEQQQRRPSYFVRAQMSSAWRLLERKHSKIRDLLPDNPGS